MSGSRAGRESHDAFRARAERIEQFLMDAAEPAVTHDEHVIAGASRMGDRRYERIEIVEGEGLVTERRKRLTQIPTERVAPRGRAIAEHEVRPGQALRQLRLHHPELHRIRAWLEHRQDP